MTELELAALLSVAFALLISAGFLFVLAMLLVPSDANVRPTELLVFTLVATSTLAVLFLLAGLSCLQNEVQDVWLNNIAICYLAYGGLGICRLLYLSFHSRRMEESTVLQEKIRKWICTVIAWPLTFVPDMVTKKRAL
jgi:hypothetical protein